MNHARSNKEARTHPTLEPAPPEDSLGRAGISGLVSLRPCTQFRHPQHPTGLGNQPKPGRLWLAGKQLHSSSYFEANCARQQPCAAAVRTPSRARLEPAHAMPEQGRQAAGACNTPLRHTQTQAQVELVAPGQYLDCECRTGDPCSMAPRPDPGSPQGTARSACLQCLECLGCFAPTEGHGDGKLADGTDSGGWACILYKEW